MRSANRSTRGGDDWRISISWIISNEDQRKAIHEIEEAKSDRVTAIVGGAFIEHDLGNALEARLRDDKKVFENLFSEQGAIGAFQAKIELGYLLRVYDKSVCSDLRLIAKIRNRAAHWQKPMTFDIEEIKNRCEQLGIVDQKEYPKIPGKGLPDALRSPPRLPSNATSRDRFIQAIKLLAIVFWAASHDLVVGPDGKHKWSQREE